MAIGTAKLALRDVDRLFSGGNVAAMPDPALVDRFLAHGDQEAFAALVARHGPKVLAACRRILGDSGLADDAFQEAFLTLARRARTIRGRRSLDGWLHRVAVRASCRALAEAHRRRDRERRQERSEAVVGRDPVAAEEEHQAVRSELERLPERYRRPVVLCLMEGRTQPEVAEALQVSEGAIRGRLARARALLRSRLARRGLAPAIGVMAVAGVEAAVSERLLEATLRAVSRRTIAGSSSLPAKAAAALLIAAISLTAASFAAATSPPSPPASPVKRVAPAAAPDVPPPQKAKEKPAPDGPKIVFRGRVLGPDDRPVKNARFFLITDAWATTAEIKPARREPDGSYRLEIPESTFFNNFNGGFAWPQVQASLTVTAPGMGLDWMNIEPGERKDAKGQAVAFIRPEYANDFHLPADRDLTGRIVGVEGKPVAGASVVVTMIAEPTDRRWGDILAELGKGDVMAIYSHAHPGRWRSPINWASPRLIPGATTDADGRFRIRGAGGDRMISLGVSGPAIRDTNMEVLNREGVEAITRVIRDKYPYKPDLLGHVVAMGGPQDRSVRLYAPDFTAPVDPACTISGVVRDAATGDPIPGAYLGIKTNAAIGGSGQMNSDARGHYRGVRWDREASMVVSASFYGLSPYLPASRKVEGGDKIGETVVDFPLRKGVVVTGKVREAGTRRPIVSNPRDECGTPGKLQAGFVLYRPLATNSALKGTPEGLHLEAYGPPHGRSSIDGDGVFQITVPPGPGVLLIEAQPGVPMMASWGMPSDEDQGLHRLYPYAKLKARAKDDGAPPSPDGDPAKLPDLFAPLSVTSYNAYKVIDPGADESAMGVTIEVPRAASRLVRFVDPLGRPISDLTVSGLNAVGFGPTILLKGTEAEVLALDGPREILAVSRDGKLVARETIRAQDDPAILRMEPSPSLAGRLVTADGTPLVNYSVGALYFDPAEPDPSNRAWENRKFPRGGAAPMTDAEGKFRLTGLIPGLHFRVEFHELKLPPNFPDGSEAHYQPKELGDLALKPGEGRDAGRISVTPAKK